MNTQDILRKGGTKLEGILDHSETYDFELDKTPMNKIITEYFTDIKTYRILTEYGGIIKTEDGFNLRY